MTMNAETVDRVATTLANDAMQAATFGARQYLTTHGLMKTVDFEVLAERLKVNIKLRYDEAVRDAKEAADCGMAGVAIDTYRATMIQAGIDAAKEVTK